MHSQKLARLFGEQRPVRCWINNHGYNLFTQQTALCILLVDQHQHGIFEGGFGNRHRAGQRMQDPDLDFSHRLAGDGTHQR